MKAFRLGQVVEALGGELHGDPNLAIQGIAPLEFASAHELSFLSSSKFFRYLHDSQAGCVIVGAEFKAQALARGSAIVCAQPYVYFAKLTQLWARHLDDQLGLPQDCLIHPSAVLHDSADVHASARIGPLCVIERGAVIGAYSVLKSRVTVGENCTVGVRCILHSGVVLGADGFGFAPNEGLWEKIEQLGAVHLGNDIEVGANTCIDRGTLGDTVIEDGVKMDNLIQIGHNVRIGRHSALAGCVGVAGSAVIGAHCTVGGGAIILGHLTLADHVHISAASVVTRSLHKPGHYSGLFPIDDNAAWEKNAATLKHLHRLRERVLALEKSRKL
ncbi:MAG: UDP-3-O-(3-hydroxymyristoyl)glucosamine N-acyltransferase [Burkholderiaceae bacterium]